MIELNVFMYLEPYLDDSFFESDFSCNCFQHLSAWIALNLVLLIQVVQLHNQHYNKFISNKLENSMLVGKGR